MSSREQCIWIYQDHLIFSKYTGQKCPDESRERYLQALKGACEKPMYMGGTSARLSIIPWFRRLSGKAWKEREGVCWEEGGQKDDAEVTTREESGGTCEGRGHDSWVSVECHWVAPSFSFTAHRFSCYREMEMNGHCEDSSFTQSLLKGIYLPTWCFYKEAEGSSYFHDAYSVPGAPTCTHMQMTQAQALFS